MASAVDHRASRRGRTRTVALLSALVVAASLVRIESVAGANQTVPSAPTVLERLGTIAAQRAANRPPLVALTPDQPTASIGRPFTVLLVASDPDGRVVQTQVASNPVGVTRNGNVVTIVPQAVGTLTIEATVSDNDGTETTTALTVPVRHRAQPELFVAMGDSVPAGTGLNPIGYLNGGDPCLRSERWSYPKKVFDRLQLGPSARFELVACAGHTTTTLTDRPVTVGGTVKRTQLDWAVEQNPGLITLSIGANNLRFDKPQELFDASGALLVDETNRRLASARTGLDDILDRLVAATDARIVVTTYHNPSGNDPGGVPGCRGACFKTASDDVTDRLNDGIRAAVAAQPTGRVLLADVAPRFEGRGAPNGLGPDALRNGGTGWLSRRVGEVFGSVHAFCDRDRGNFASLISAVDCIHPNVFGHDTYADVVTEAIRRADLDA